MRIRFGLICGLFMLGALGSISGAPVAWAASSSVSMMRSVDTATAALPATNCIVTSAADSGAGTLRQCLQTATSGTVITFNAAVFPPASPATIRLTSGQLPDLSAGNVTLDASSAGVILDGSAFSGGEDGFSISSNGNTVRGLQILGFPGDAIEITGGSNMIGGTTTGSRNVLSGNGRNGIFFHGPGAVGNTVKGNTIGADASGLHALPNRQNGVQLADGANGNLIGGATAAERNLIFANRDSGVDFNGAATTNNTVQGNWIGLGLGPVRQAFPNDQAISPAYATDCTLFVATLSTGVHKSTDCGATWAEVNNGLTQTRLAQVEFPPDTTGPDFLFALAENGDLFVTHDGGTSWSLVSTVLEGIDRRNLALSADFKHDHTLYASAQGWAWNELGGQPGVFKSTDEGVTWARASAGMSNTNVWKVIASPDPAAKNTLFALTNGGIEKSTDGGAHWTVVPAPDANLRDLALSPAFAADHTLFVAAQNGPGRIYRSIDGGATWSGAEALRGDPQHLALSPDFVHDRKVCHGGGWNDFVYCSTDAGVTWTQAETKLPAPLRDYGTAIAFSPGYVTDHTMFVVSFAGMSKSTDGGATWALARGLRDLGNVTGVSFSEGANHNTIGPNNLISNNDLGVTLNGDSTAYNVVAGNLFGTDQSGASGLGSPEHAIAIWGGHDNLIGGDSAAERNVINGSLSASAVWLNGPGVISNIVSGNYIGLDITGATIIGNTDGVGIVNGASHNVIGGTTPGERNVISGNNDRGVSLTDTGTGYNRVSGNYIGLNAAGTAALGNRGQGVGLMNGANFNIIGGPTAGERNVVSGNNDQGIALWNTGTADNTIQGNYVGTDASGNSALGNGQNGIYLNGASGNTLKDNLVGGNHNNGIQLCCDGATANNRLIGNRIGVNAAGAAALPNDQDGIYVNGGANHNSIGGAGAGEGNLIRNNHGHGVRVQDSGTVANTITRNGIGPNDGAGIALRDGGNVGLSAPRVIAKDLAAGTASGTACANCTVEVFSASDNEGQTYAGAAVANGTGAWTLAAGHALAGPYLTATATDAAGNTSPFASPFNLLVFDLNVQQTRQALENLGLSYTLVDAAGFATIKLADYDVIFVGFTGNDPQPDGLLQPLLDRKADIAAFVQGGGGLVANSEDGVVRTALDWLWTPTPVTHRNAGGQQMRIALPGHELVDGLTETSLQGWAPFHNTFTQWTWPEAEVVLTDPGSGEAIVLAGAYGTGRMVFSGSDPDYHSGNAGADRLLFNELYWAAKMLRPRSPQVSSFAPAADTATAITALIQVAFDKMMDATTINAGAFSVVGSVSGAHTGTITYLSGPAQAVFVPAVPFTVGERVTVTLRGTIKDVGGRGLDGNRNGISDGSPTDDFAWSFTVRAGSTCTVNSTADSGAGTLRQCLQDAQPSDTIAFASATFPLAQPATIALTSGALPGLNQGYVTIDADNLGVILDGSNLTSGSGFRITSAGNAVYGIKIVRFPDDGVEIDGSAAWNNTIGKEAGGRRNVIGANGRNGIRISNGASSNTVGSNYIGLDVSSWAALPNGENGVAIQDGASYNLIGAASGAATATAAGSSLPPGNIIFANVNDGVSIWGGGAINNTVRGNWLGLRPGNFPQATPADMAVSPAYTTDGVVYVATASGGIYKSADRGVTWTQANTGLTEQSFAVVRIPPDATNANTAYALAEEGALFVTHDGAATWSLVSRVLEQLDRRGLTFSPRFATDHTIYTAAQGWADAEVGGQPGVFKSTDGGVTWSRSSTGLTDTRIRGVFASTDPGAAGVLYALGDSSLQKSIDGGASWTSVAIPSSNLQDMAVSPAFGSDNTLVVVASGPGGGQFLISIDRGATWTTRNDPRGDPRHVAFSPSYAADHRICHGGGWNDYLYCTTDGGANWTQTQTALPGPAQDAAVSVAFAPGYSANHTLFVLSVAGMSRSADGGASWQLLRGLRDLGNTSGVRLGQGASYNTIGPENVIANNNFGVQFNDEATAYNVVAGNLIGLAPGGTAVLSNSDQQVGHWGGHHNRIGGPAAGDGNTIVAGPGGYSGIYLTNGESHDTLIQGNRIGTDITGLVGLGSRGDAISITDNTQDNTILGNVLGASGTGIQIRGNDTRNNRIAGNMIGVGADGRTALGHRGAGMEISGGAHDNLVGGTTSGDRNIIAANQDDGVRIQDSDTRHNTVSGNWIGLDASGAVAGNGRSGVSISNGSHDNLIGGPGAADGNVIAGNSQFGVGVWGTGATGNTIRRNAIYGNNDGPDNRGQGIRLWGGGNADLAAPLVTAWNLNAGTLAGTACPGCTVEIFSDQEDQGRYYEGTTTAAGDGTWAFAKGAKFTGNHPTATATDAQGNTSPFSVVPYLRVNQSHDWIDGQVGQGGVPVQVAVLDAQGHVKGSGKTTTRADGGFSGQAAFSSDGQQVDIVAGDVAQVTIGAGWVITSPVLALTGDVDIASDTVSGRVPDGVSGQPMRAELFETPDYNGDVWGTLQSDHSYALHMGFQDVQDGSMVAVWYRSPQGNYVGIVRHWLQLGAQTGANWVGGSTAAKSAVQVVVTDSLNKPKAASSVTADAEGRFGSDLGAVTIAVGDKITATATVSGAAAGATPNASSQRTSVFVVPELLGVLDPEIDAVCGVAPAGAEIYLNLWNVAGDWYQRTDWIKVDAIGHFCFDAGFDLRSDYRGEVVYYSQVGHRLTAGLTVTERQAAPLALGVPIADKVEPLAYRDYSLAIGAGERLLVKVTPGAGAGQLWLYGRLGSLPTRSTYDFKTTQPAVSGSYELLMTPTQAGKYYFSIFGWDITGGQGAFTITASTLDRRLSDVQPRSGANTGRIAATFQGLGFVEGMRAELRRTGVPTVPATDIALSSYTSLLGQFDLRTLPAGAYDVAVKWPDNGELVLAGAFQVTQGSVAAELTASVQAPDYVRPGRTFALWVDYASTGGAEMDPPLLIVDSPTNTPLRLNDNEPFGTEPLQILGIGDQAGAAAASADTPRAVGFGPELAQPSAASASPDLSVSLVGHLPVWFSVPDNTPGHAILDFTLSRAEPSQTAIDWTAVESEVRPSDISPEVWAVFWPALKANVGATWADYQKTLVRNAQYLASLGRRVYVVRDLWRFEVRKVLGMNPRQTLAGAVDAACPASDLPLEFGRVFPGSLEGRFYQGPLGRGWSHSYDISVEELQDGNVAVHFPGSFRRLFRPDVKVLVASAQTGVPWPSYVEISGDRSGRLTYSDGHYQLVEKDGVTYAFRTDRKLDLIQDRNGNRITATYDGAGRLTRLQHINGDHLDLTYNGQGHLASLTDCAGKVTTYGYDAAGAHLVSVTAPGSRVTSYAYQAAAGAATDHALQTVTFPDGRHQYFGYDSLGRLTDEHLDGNAERVTYAYDVFGRIQITDQTGRITRLAPDENGQPTRIQDGLGRVVDEQHDSKGQLVRVVDPAGQSTTLDYDTQGNVIGSRNPQGQQIKLDYDYRFNQVATLQDARGKSTAFSYDAAGNLAAMTYPGGAQEKYTYDAAGNPLTFTDRVGWVTTYTYDPRGQLLQKTHTAAAETTTADAAGSDVSYTYDTDGNITSATNAQGTIQMQYDVNKNLLTRITYPDGHWFSFTYDAAGRRTQRTGEDGFVLNYTYDDAGRLWKLTDGANQALVTYEYDGAGRLVKENKGNGTYTAYAYDAAGQVLHLVNYASGGAVQSRFDYTYDANGNRTSMTTLDGVTSYAYDALGQLTGVTYPGGHSVAYAYDATGNRVSVTDNGVVTSYTTNDLNQYTQVGDVIYTYDANGSMATSTDAGGTTTYTYDAENRLVRVAAPDGDTWEYTYDALGNRTTASHNGVVTRYVSDPIGLVDVAAEYDGTGALAARYVHGAGLVARIDVAGSAVYYAFDAIGNTRQVSNGSGGVVNHYDYDPFGNTLDREALIANPFEYVGRLGVMTGDDGPISMRARYYEPVTGRFMSCDPLGLQASSNLYVYAANNPVSITDPQGTVAVFAYGAVFLWKMTTTTWGIAGAATDVGRSLPTMDFSDSKKALTKIGARLVLGAVAGFIAPDPSTAFLEGYVVSAAYSKWDRVMKFGELLLWTMFPPKIPESDRNQRGRDGSEVLRSDDPNEKVGPAGVGSHGEVLPSATLPYVIYFENQTSASAPAQEVVIDDWLDPDLDWTTLSITEVGWGDQVIAAPVEGGDWTARATVADYRTNVGRSWWVDVDARTDYTTGHVRWTLHTLDPQTEQPPEDPLAGFLPPNDASGRGQGYVAFTVQPKTGLPDGTLLTNKAAIVFDVNQPIVTNEVANVIWRPHIYLPLVVRR